MANESNVKDDVCYAQPKLSSSALRLRMISRNASTFRFPSAWTTCPTRRMTRTRRGQSGCSVVDEAGRIAYRGGNGPFKYNPKEVRDWLASRYGEVKHPEAKPAEKAPEKSAEKPEEKPQVSK